jgi:Flp pilus assembly protein TadG
MSRRSRHERRLGGNAGQTMVETALVIPIFLLLACATVDAGRIAYTLSIMKANAEATARQVTLFPNRTSDCSAWATGETSPGLLKLVPDPAALASQASFAPTAAASVPSNTGYIYIYPAVSTATPQDSGTNCQATLTGRPKGTRVQVRITYHFTAWTPIPGPLGTLLLSADASGSSEY